MRVLVTLQYKHLISRRILVAVDNELDILWLKSILCIIPDNLIKQLHEPFHGKTYDLVNIFDFHFFY